MIPVCEPTLMGNELKYVSECVKTSWISSGGKFLKQFEESFSAFCGVNEGVACCNGTVAIHLALEAMGIGKGDEVIIPDFTMIASANAVIYSGAKPVLVDSELSSWNMDPEKIEERITKKTKAIMVVHTYGHPCDMDKIRKIADRHNLKIVEDAAEAHGAEYKGKRAGSLSDVAAFSFYGNKILTTGEGGMVVTNDEKIAERARLLRNHAFGNPRFLHKEIGYNYRMTNMQAAVGVAQVEVADKLIEMRRNNAKLYNDLLSDVKGIVTPPELEGVKNVYWMYGVLVDEEQFGMNMPTFREKLLEKGVDTRTFFIGMHNQPVFEGNDERFPNTKGDFVNSEFLEKNGCYLPSTSHLTEEQIKTVVDTIRDIQNG